MNPDSMDKEQFAEHAMKCHDELVGLLSRVLNLADTCHEDNRYYSKTFLQDLREAIKRARGES